MKYYFGWLIWLCILIILFITRCDKTCQMTKSITENLRQAQEQQMIYSWHVDKATEYLKKYQEEIKQASKAKVLQRKHEKEASNIYWSGLAFGNYAYAWWDEWLTWSISKMETTWLVDTWHSKRDLLLMSRVCWTAKGKSPMCNDWTMYYSWKKIFENAGVPRGIALWIMNAESNIWVNYAWTCDSSWNNRWGIKWRKNDDWTTTKDQAIPNNWNCYLYKFDSIEDYFKSKANTLWLWYKSCFKTDNPIRCISYSYVWNPKVAEPSWIKNVAKIAE